LGLQIFPWVFPWRGYRNPSQNDDHTLFCPSHSV
jgi:hypothetical protein